jgi:GNAT superfamily N-acetyltransferase
MSGAKYLIDTNVFIGLEDTREVAPDFASLQQLASRHGVGIFIHDAAKDDIARDKDEARRRISLSKIAKFQTIAKVRGLSKVDLEAEFGTLARPNDVVDATLLHALRIGVVDFLVTEDGGLHDRARRHAPEIADRVLFVADATALLRSTYEPQEVQFRYVEEVEAHTIRTDDPIFESLREGYPQFDAWWRDSCVAKMRKCWVVTDNDGLAGLVVRKDESATNTDATLPGERILKVCTFKVRPERRGLKLGELLLKQILWFAQKNTYDAVYLTTFSEQSALISLIEYYGFARTKVADDGELTFEKGLCRAPLARENGADLFDLAARSYPRFCADSSVAAYGIPIQEDYHEVLFPELRDDRQQDLFEYGGLGTGPRKAGNTIRKVYLCHAPANLSERGALLFFYKGQSQKMPSQAFTTVGIFENMTLARSTEELRRLAGGRSVYSERQLQAWNATPDNPVKVINFLLAGHLSPAMEIDELRKVGVIAGQPPQSIFKLNHSRRAPLLARLDLGFSLQ